MPLVLDASAALTWAFTTPNPSDLLLQRLRGEVSRLRTRLVERAEQHAGRQAVAGEGGVVYQGETA